MTGSVRERVAPMRAITIALSASILLSIAAAAQDQSKDSSGRVTPPASAGKKIPQAPVGHRQPTQRSLPPAVRKEEDAAVKPPDPLGPIPSICKNC
ncbi:MAG TPA: hypothetical protein VFO74_12335 [Pseudolabrys sp.]|nr:hypothetical protein [Pseudolabrys sp.]